MLTKTTTLLFITMVLLFSAASQQYNSAPAQESKTKSDAPIKFPENYRQWVYLTTGFDMSYNPAMSMDHHMFDNVFVNPEAYKAFVETGTWPDKTVLVLEIRNSATKLSINKDGRVQTDGGVGEIHVKDSSRGGWAFYGFAKGTTEGTLIPKTENCYSCHDQNGAVDSTFVQFYPTLIDTAKSKGTFKDGRQ